LPDLIFKAVTSDDYREFAKLIRAYVDWCRTRYREHQWIVEAAFGYQSLDDELAHLSTSYGSPQGTTLLAESDGQIQGCVAYHRLSDSVCEMKRLFVANRCRRSGLGKRLCLRIMEEAKSDGYTLMRLDTGYLFHEAQKLYSSVGFAKCDPYNDYPAQIMPFIVFMERLLY
jgi:GNAT superfamily N-acetyltransferase